MSEYIYKINNLSFGFDRIKPPIIENVNINIKRGKLTTILGINGSGKSTLLKLLINQLTPDIGEILFLNKNIQKIGQKKLSTHISYVGQNPNENIPLTVEEVVNFGNHPYEHLFFRDAPHFKENLQNALLISGTHSLKDRLFTQLSIGQKQKVMVARAVCQNTDVILLDEPTSSLDIKNEVEIMDMLKKLVIDKKKSIVLICHNLNLVSKYADEVIFIKDRNVKTGEKETLFSAKELSNIFDTKIDEINKDGTRIFY